ncbi:MAG: acetylornithine transaminase [Gammaproteobacteria bacterium]|nr:acetylornithine transaminase [Gammaproteobacteria bacterium]
MNKHLMQNYAPLPVTFKKGEGVWLWDNEGKKYLDALSGVAVCSLGHAHPAVTAAICQQAQTLVHTSNWYEIENQYRLAEKLTALSGMDNVFFSNSGAEANEAAIKLARLYGHSKDIAIPNIIVMEGSFHGRTMATLTATGNRKVQAGFEPLVQGFVRAPYNDLTALENIAKNNNDVVAVMLEPIIGEGGIQIPDEDYLSSVRKLCNKQGWLLILDEIQTGMGRTGKWFAYEHSQITPDILTLAKALGNGMPIGACLAKGQAAELFQPGHHGSTYGGNPLVCAAALAVIDTMEKEKLPQRAAELGQRMLKGFQAALADVDSVVDIRGKGMMLAVELDRPCGEILKQALDSGLLLNITADNVVRLLPPLVLTDAEADQIVSMTSKLIQSFLN